jgi:SAM-dependent methyltransferase
MRWGETPPKLSGCGDKPPNSNPWPPTYWTESAALRDKARSTSDAALVESSSCSPSASAPRGRVVGLEVDPVHVAMARGLVAEQGLTNVEVTHADARNTGLPPASFDVAHARTVLVNVPDPEAVLADMTRLVRAGGWVASLEPDVAVHLYHPANPAWDRLHEISIAAFQADGANPFIGRRLPELFREAGLSDIGVRAQAELYPPGHTRRTIRVDLVRSMRSKIVALGIASEQELDDLDRAAREHLDDPHTLVLPHLFFLAWGRKPTT